MGIHKFDIFSEENATNGSAMAVQKLSSRVDYKIYSIPEWLLQVWCGKSVIARNDLTIFLTKLRKFFNIHALYSWISRCFQVDHPDLPISFQYVFSLVQIT